MSGPRRFGHGLVIGKFYPFHAGHQALVRAATSSCDRVTVEVMVQGVESIPASVRVGWVQGEHPDARVVTVLDEHPVDFESPEVWDLHMAVIEAPLERPVDAVFSSDTYGEELARRLDATWVQVDPGRASTPISGTAIRLDPAGNWWALPTPVRQWFTRRVVVFGADPDDAAQSQAPAVLARAIAEHYGTQLVPDHTREWIQRSKRPGELLSNTVIFELAADHQAAAEQQAAGRAPRPLVVCESNASAIAFSLEGPPALPDEAPAASPSLYVLVGDVISRTQSPTPVDAPGSGRVREALERLRAHRGTPWVEVTGSPTDQLAAAVAAVDDVVAAGWSLADPLG